MSARLRVWSKGWESAMVCDADQLDLDHLDLDFFIVSEVESRHYTIGLPVTVTIDDDGTVTITTYLGEAAEGVADYDDDLDPSTPGLQEQQAADVVTIAAAIEAGNYTATTSKGA